MVGMRRTLPGLLLFILMSTALRPASPPDSIPCVWDGVDRIIAVGDLHGAYDNFVTILKGTGLVDDQLKWAGGKTHFVQMGDVMDRGPGAKQIFDLIRRLETEADSAGGMVHLLLGNHEEMNITGIAFDYAEYITLEQYLSFVPPAFQKKIERDFKFAAARDTRDDPVKKLTKGLEDYWREVMKTAEGREAYMEGLDAGYSEWLLKKNAVIKINDTIFVHGGINEKYSAWNLADLNSSIRAELGIFWGRRNALKKVKGSFEPEIVYDRESPMWYRELAIRDEGAFKNQFERILGNLHAGHMVIAHTVNRNNGMSQIVSPLSLSRFDGRLWMIDTGISETYGGVNSALFIEKGDFVLWTDNDAPVAPIGLRETQEPGASPSDNPEDFLRNGKIGTIVRGSLWGRTAPWTIVLIEGAASKKAVFKYVDRPRPDPLADSYRYELAAYALSVRLGLDLVPPIVEREIEGIKGSLQVFLEGTISESARKRQGLEPKDPEAFRKSLDAARIFGLLVGDGCDKPDDTLIDPWTWHVSRVDFSQAFPPSPDIGPDCGISGDWGDIRGKLRKMDDGALGEFLSPYLAKDEIAGLIARKARLIAFLDRMSR
jgi:hypothetical protein